MLIGLIGLKGSGKDTLVNTLSVKYGTNKIINLKFANGIKEMLSNYFDVPESVYESYILKEARIVQGTRLTVRELMIKIGSFFREINPNFWVNCILQQYKSVKSLYPISVVIITDCRYPNEIKAIIDNGGFILDVRRNNLYSQEKRIIKRYGVNFISRLLVKKINPLLTHDSEWNYFNLSQHNQFPIIDNTVLSEGLEQLEDFIYRL